MVKTVEFYFDYGSPASYLAWAQMPALAERTGAQIEHRPMLLGGVFKATGNSSPVTVPAKGAYMWIDLGRWARAAMIPLRQNDAFPVNTLAAMRGAVVAKAEGFLERYSKAMFEAMWAENKNLSDPEVMVAVLTGAGLDAGHLAERTADPAIKQMLISNTEEAVARGVFGAPTFFVDGEMFWGQDRLAHLEAALRP